MKEWRSFLIKDLAMPTSAKRVLMHEGYETLGDLENMTDAEMLRLPSFGRESLWQFRNAQLAVRGSHVPVTHAISLPLRDWFAGQALVGLLIDEGMGEDGTSIPEMCWDAYRYADAMLEAREKEQ